MTANDSIWTPAQELDPQDQRLVNAYLQISLPLDALPYTEQFRTLVTQAGLDSSDESVMHSAYLRLMNLRKRGRLPRASITSKESA